MGSRPAPERESPFGIKHLPDHGKLLVPPARQACVTSPPLESSAGSGRKSLKLPDPSPPASGNMSTRSCEDVLLARGERSEHARRRLAQVGLDCGIDRQDRVLVLDEVAQVRIFLIADRRLERDRLLGDLHHLADLVDLHRYLLYDNQY